MFSLLPRAGLLQTRVKGDGNDFRTLTLSSHSCFVFLFEPSLLFLLLQPELGLQSHILERNIELFNYGNDIKNLLEILQKNLGQKLKLEKCF